MQRALVSHQMVSEPHTRRRQINQEEGGRVDSLQKVIGIRALK